MSPPTSSAMTNSASKQTSTFSSNIHQQQQHQSGQQYSENVSYTLSNVPETFYVTPVTELEKLDDWKYPSVFNKLRHEQIDTVEEENVEWRLKDRMKTVSVALVMCLHIGVDPPDITKTNPCSKLECWIDPFSMTPRRAIETIAIELQRQYERWQSKARYKSSLDPTQEDIKKLCLTLRRNAKDERILFHYNGHGVPRPTSNGEIWVFNKNFTQYIPLSLYDLQKWMGSPSIYVFDCSNAAIIVNLFVKFAEQIGKEFEEARRTTPNAPCPPLATNDILLAACSEQELLPMNAELPADLFTSCLTTPIKIALRWYVLQKNISRLNPTITLEMIDKIPGTVTDRKSMLGELNWIFTAVTDTIAWNSLPKELFQRLFRQDLLVASLFRNFLLAERIMRSYGCHVVSRPELPPMFEHTLWNAWDMALDLCLKQLPSVLKQLEAGVREPQYEPNSFFADQLTAFQVWLGENTLLYQNDKMINPEQLPIVLQVLLSQSHRLRALDLLAKFLDLGSWAVNLALSVGIFPYVLRLLQATSDDLRRYLVFIWAKILALDKSCQGDIIREKGHDYFIQTLTDARIPKDVRALAAFDLTCLVDNNSAGQEALLSLISRSFDLLNTPSIQLVSSLSSNSFSTSCSDHDLFLWLTLFLAQCWKKNSNACEKAILSGAPDHLQQQLLNSDSAEVRAASAYAFGTYLSTQEYSEKRIEQNRNIATILLTSIYDCSPIVRKEVLVALYYFMNLFPVQIINSINGMISNGQADGIWISSNPTKTKTASQTMKETNSLYKTVFDKVVETVMVLYQNDPYPEIVQMAEKIVNHYNRLIVTTESATLRGPRRTSTEAKSRTTSETPTADIPSAAITSEKIEPLISTKFYQWCCSRFRKPNTARDISRMNSGDCFLRYGRYWRNYTIRANQCQLVDFQRMNESVVTKLNAIPISIRFHPYENYFITADKDSNISFYELIGGKADKKYQFTVPQTNASLQAKIQSKITSLDFMNAHDQTLVCVGSTDNAIRIYEPKFPNTNGPDVSSHRLVSSWIALYDIHRIETRKSYNLIFDWNQNLSRFYTSGDVNCVRLWDVEKEKCLQEMLTGSPTGVTAICSDKNGHCAVGLADGTLRLFDVRSRDSTSTIISTDSKHPQRIISVAFLQSEPDRLLSISGTGELHRWDRRNGGIYAFPSTKETNSNSVLVADVHPAANVIAIARQSELQLISCLGDNMVDIRHPKLSCATCMHFHPYKQLLAVGFNDSFVSLFSGKI